MKLAIESDVSLMYRSFLNIVPIELVIRTFLYTFPFYRLLSLSSFKRVVSFYMYTQLYKSQKHRYVNDSIQIAFLKFFLISFLDHQFQNWNYISQSLLNYKQNHD